jgi:hypothetical protein
MNRTLTFAALVVVAVPLFAADPKPVPNPVQQPVQADSPLVAAAKRANRLGKKPAFVITNETLVTAGGHFTTTVQQAPIHPLPPISTDVITTPRPAGAPNAGVEQEKQRAAERERQKVVKQLQMQYDGDTLNEDLDPAQMEHQMQQLQKPEEKKP